MFNNTVIIICGPTAVGKTAFAIKLAKALNTRIISADSRQCFKELSIGVAKPSPQELSEVHHYFINSHSIHEEVNAMVFEKYALQAVEDIFQGNHTAVMVGGTGLYIKAFCEGMDNIPDIGAEIRQQIIGEYEAKGISYLQQQLQEKDRVFWETAEQQNPQRLMRALEVVLSTGRSITEYRKGIKLERPFKIIKVALESPREKLYDQINRRVDLMIEHGLVEEVKSLLPFKHINALQTVGYRELFEFFEGKVNIDKAITDIKTNTRHYAKRQLTWFKKDTEITWFDANDSTAISAILKTVSYN